MTDARTATAALWVPACRLEQIEPEGVRRFDHDGRTYAVYRSLADEVFCTDGLCTHEAVHLEDGLVMDYGIECPRHSGLFDISTCEARRLPACVNLRTWPDRVEDGTILIAIG